MRPLTEEQAALLDLVGRYAETELAPRAGADERAEAFPRDLFDGLARMDLTGLPFAAGDGGSDQPYGLYLRVLERLAHAHICLALGLSVHTLATWAVDRYASEPLRAEVLPRMTSGRWLGAYCLSEPGSGSDAASLSTRAEREDDDYVITGTKAWVTHAGLADFYVVFCRTEEHRTRGITALLVPADTAGMTFPPHERKMGMLASPTGQIVFDEARVPVSHRVGEEGEGFRIALAALDGGRLGIAACATGLAQAALDHAAGYAREREQFGQPIGQFQGVAFLLADMAAAVESGRAVYREAAARRDDGEPYATMASIAKLVATDAAMQVTTDAVQVFGGYGYTTEYPVERLMRAAKVMQIFEGTNQIQRLVISRSLLAD